MGLFRKLFLRKRSRPELVIEKKGRSAQGPVRRLWHEFDMQWPAVNALILVAALAVVSDLLPFGWQVAQVSKLTGAPALTNAAPTKLPRVIRFQTSQTIAGIASVIDGDTIEIHGQRIRFWGIDAPESGQLCRLDGKQWQCGQQAALVLSDYIGQQTVSCKQRDLDRYGRVVAVCGINRTPDLSNWLVSQGWALDWPRYSHGAYSFEQGKAKLGSVGMWRGDFDKPWEWRQAR